MLRQRILTGLVLAAAVTGAVIYVPVAAAAGLAVALVLAAFEWAQLSRIKNKFGIGVFVFGCLGLGICLYLLSPFSLWINTLGILVWCVIAVKLRRPGILSLSSFAQCIFGLLILPLSVFAIASVFIGLPNGAYWVLGLLAIVSTADIAAYAFGKRFGKTKAAPRISPGKTVEGIKGCFFSAFALGLISGTLIWQDDYSSILLWTGVCLLVSLLAVFGDLFVSVQKRICAVKDSGRLLPGHGGVLDRVDSTLAAAPLYAFLTQLLIDHQWLAT